MSDDADSKVSRGKGRRIGDDATAQFRPVAIRGSQTATAAKRGHPSKVAAKAHAKLLETAMPTPTTLERLCDAFCAEIERQRFEGLERIIINGITPPSKGCRDRVIIDGELYTTSIIVAVLRELRKLPEQKVIEEIDLIVGQVEQGRLTPKRKRGAVKPAGLSRDGKKLLTALRAMPNHRIGVPFDELLTQGTLAEDVFVDAFGLLEEHGYVSVKPETREMILTPQGAKAAADT